MKIQVSEPGGFKHGRDHYKEGEVRDVGDDLGAEFVRLGWAVNLATGESGVRNPGARALHVHDQVIRLGSDAPRSPKVEQVAAPEKKGFFAKLFG